MAAGILSTPGTSTGPCKKQCSHTDCIATRNMANSACVICEKDIGYGRRFYNAVPITGRSDQFVHAACYEDYLDGRW